MSKKIFNQLFTDEYNNMNKNNPMTEYPNPQFKRDSYISLNGIWKYKISSTIDLNNIDNDILVPFPIESYNSMVQKRLKKNESIIYKKEFSIPKEFLKDITYIHFMGVDQKYKIILNGKEYSEVIPLNLPTKIDISDSIKEDNELIVIAMDNLDPKYPLGKQSNKPKGIFYTPFSGIYYPVYIESVSNDYIENIKINTTMNSISLDIISNSNLFDITIKDNDNIIKNITIASNKIDITIENPILWEIDNPHLYDLVISTKNDKIESYFGLREIKQNNGFIYLNNKKIFLNGVLDQGYFPEGIITPSTYKSYEIDILTMKELGFNTLRKHIKLEMPYFYYLCDKYGMLVMQDFINNGKYSFLFDTALPTIGYQKKNDKNMNKNQIQRDNFVKCGEELINLINNHPSIIAYTIFNEGWGQFDSNNVYKHFKNIYPNIIFDTASGWYRGGKTDLDSYHWYFKNIDNIKTIDHPIFLSEFGALCYKLDGHAYGNRHVFGYRYFDSIDDTLNEFVKLYEEKIIPYKDKLIGIIYTQLSDIEEEDNGIMSYDRKIIKFDKDKIKEILNKLK